MTARAMALTTLGLLALLLSAPSELAAHGEAALESSVASVPAGGSVTLSGSLFVPGESHRLVLRGTLEDHELGEVTAAGDSTFSRTFEIPVDVRPGQYRVVAIAPDGDEVANLDLPVLAAERTASASDGSGAAGDAPPTPQARADEIEIERSRAGLEWGVIGVVIGLAGGLGLGLVRRS